MPEKTLTLDEAAEEAALSPEEIKQSEEIGILPREKYEFTENDLQMLNGIKCLKQLGLSLQEIAEINLAPVVLAEINQYLGAIPAPAPKETCLLMLSSAKAVLRTHLDSINLQIEQLEIQKRSLEHRLDSLNQLSHKLYTKIQR